MLSLLTEDPSPWFTLLGRSHPVVLHMPLGLVPAMFLLEFGALLIRRESPRGSICALAWLAAISAALATASGLVLAGENGSESELVGNHKIAGIVFGSVCVLLAIVSGLRKRAPFRILLLLGLVAMLPAGHLGGSITHGPDFLTEPFDVPKERQVANAGAQNDGSGDTGSDNGSKEGTANGDEAGGDTPTALPEVVTFRDHIQPFLERVCTKCHNPDKTKGELLLTTVEGIQKGGDYGPVIVAGDPKESALLYRCRYPLDDDEHMPPEGKPQPTERELQLLERWIAAGAKFE